MGNDCSNAEPAHENRQCSYRPQGSSLQSRQHHRHLLPIIHPLHTCKKFANGGSSSQQPGLECIRAL